MKRKSKILIFGLFILIAFLMFQFVFPMIWFNPNKDIDENNAIFNIITQLTCPSLTEATLDKSNSTPDFFMGNDIKKFNLLKSSLPDKSGKIDISGTLKFSYNQVSVDKYEDEMGLGSLTCKQETFVYKGENQIDNIDLNVDCESYYEVWLCFKDPISLDEFKMKYNKISENNYSKSSKSGVLWIPVKTSDNNESLCIGMAGNYSFYYLMLSEIFPITNNYYMFDIYDRYDLFEQTLDFLVEHKSTTNIFLQSGLWPDAEKLDFAAIKKYVKENQVECLGMVTYIRGDLLLDLKKDDNISIFHVYP